MCWQLIGKKEVCEGAMVAGVDCLQADGAGGIYRRDREGIKENKEKEKINIKESREEKKRGGKGELEWTKKNENREGGDDTKNRTSL